MRTTLKRGTGRNGPQNGHVVGIPAIPPPPPPAAPPQVTRYGPPRRSPWRLVGKILLWIVVVLLVVIGALVGGFWLWIRQSVEHVGAHTPEAIAAEKVLDVPTPGQPAVAMVIGYDKRPGGSITQSRSDTIMLIRVDPDSDVVSMLSFPRDLRVDIPGCKGHLPWTGRINEAFSECGPRGTLETVKQFAGVPVNYLITVNFHGFQEIVDNLGGVYVDVDHRYFNDNSGLGYGSTYDKINLEPGYQRLNGTRALDYVRYRHTDSDLYRNARQQEFVKAFKQQISSFSSVSKIPAIVSTITRNVEVGVGGGKQLDVKTVYGYARLLYDLPAGNFQQVRLEGLADIPGTYELSASPEAVQQAVDAFQSPDAAAPEKAAAVATGKKPKRTGSSGPRPADVSITVLNGNGRDGSSDDAAYLLSKRGYVTSNGGNADGFDYFETTIRYDASNPEAKAAAESVAVLFGDAEVEPAPDTTPMDTMLAVVVGQTFHGTLAPLPKDTTPEHEKPNVAADTASRAAVANERKKLDFTALAPAVIESGAHLSTMDGLRRYRLAGHDALRLTYESPDGIEYWGIQETSWQQPPILDGPSTTRAIDGREYRLLFNGSHLHVVAFEQDDAVYWVTNTLLDSLSNETMLAIAKGLKPVR